MRIAKNLIFLFLFLAAGLGIVRFIFLDQLTTMALSRAGVRDAGIHFSALNPGKTQIDTLQATFKLPSGELLPLILKDVSLQYSLQHLLTAGKCSRISIGVMEIRRALHQDHPSPLSLPTQITLLRNELRSRLPLEELRINQLLLTGDVPEQVRGKDIQLHALVNNTEVTADLSLQLTDDTRITVAMNSADARQGTATVTGIQGNDEIIKAAITLTPEALSTTVDLQLQPVRNLLLQTADIQEPVRVDGRLSAHAALPLPLQENENIQAQLSAEKLSLGTARVEGLSLDLSGTFNLNKDQFLLQFTSGQQLQIQELSAGKLDIKSLQAVSQSPLQIALQQGIWSVSPNSFQIRPMQIAHGGTGGVTGPVVCKLTRLDNTDTTIGLDATVTTPSLVLNNPKMKLPLKDLSSTVHMQQNLISGTMQLAPQSIPGRVKTTFSHNLSTGAGSFTLRTDRRFDVDQEEVSLARLFTPWHYPFDLDHGKISFKANGSWATNKKLRLAAFAAVTDGGGYCKQFVFNGLNIRQDLVVLPRLFSKRKGSFSLQQLIGAVDVHDIQADLNFIHSKKGPLPKLKINDFNASLFAGTVSAPAILYDLNQPDTAFTVTLKNMDLTTMTRMIQMDSLHVTGKVSGAIPVRIKGKEISVDNGTLFSEPPGGEIRYTPENMNQTGITGYALKAVEDFRYDSLKTTAVYLPSGQLDLDIRLQGISPQLSRTRPVHLNIHAEQNLPSLLQSLRFSKGLTDELDKRVKQHYK